MKTLDLKIMPIKDWIAATLIVFLTAFLVLFSMYANDIQLSERLGAAMNKQLFYQPITLLIALLLLATLAVMYKEKFSEYFRIGKIDSKILPEPIVGIKPKQSDSWLNVGLNFLIVISVVTAVVIYFQIIGNEAMTLKVILTNLPTVLLFALSNAFVEESVTRIAPIIILKDKIEDKHIAIISGVLFGIAHFWGSPGGIPGMLFAGFMGWLLAKSVLETKGIFWALLIHFVQDVIIISAFMVIGN